MKNILFLCYLLCQAIVSTAQSPSRGFSLLNESNFVEAHDAFAQAVRKQKDITAAYYGLALLQMNGKTPYFNLDTAYATSCQADKWYDALEKKDRDNLYQKYKISGTSIALLKYNISVDAFKAVNVEDEKDLSHFIERFPGERTAAKAKELLAQVDLLKNMTDDKSIEYYKNIVELYPNNPKTLRAWQRFYELATGDGDFLSMEQFLSRYPDFPLDSLARKDISIIKFCVANKCVDYVSTANETNCRKYIQMAASKNTALLVFKNLVKTSIDSRDWAKVKNEVATYEKFFAGSKDFASFKKTINRNDPPGMSKSIAGKVNTPTGLEYSPVISANGQHLYFCGARRPDNLGGEDIFVSTKTDEGWSNPQILQALNTKIKNEAPEAVSTDETKLVFYSEGDIFMSVKSASGWKQMQPLQGVNSRGWDGDATFSADGNAIIFASEGWAKVGVQYPGKNRKDLFDLYVSVKTKKGWSTPQNLGLTVNTPWCDRYPFLHPDGKTLYFSSEGHGSLGGSDVFRCVRLSDTSWTQWSEPQNLGKSINSTGDDNGYKISTDGTEAFYSVNRNKNIDIYSTTLPDDMKPGNVAILSGIMRDENGKPVEAEIRVEDLETGEELFVLSSDPREGSYVIVLPMGKNYGFYVSRPGSYPTSQNIDLTRQDKQLELRNDISIPSLASVVEKGEAIVINNVFFDTDKFDLRPESFLELDRLASILRIYPTYVIAIEGHTDSDGSREHNQELSENRASSVKQYLVSKGLGSDRVTAVGYGSSRPASSNTSSSGKQQNRRVEIRFSRGK